MTNFNYIHIPRCVCVGSEMADAVYPYRNFFLQQWGQDNVAGRAWTVDTLPARSHYPHGFVCLYGGAAIR